MCVDLKLQGAQSIDLLVCTSVWVYGLEPGGTEVLALLAGGSAACYETLPLRGVSAV
jgi:hypothetical protein